MKLTDSINAYTEVYDDEGSIKIYSTIEQGNKQIIWSAVDETGTILFSDYDYYDLLDWLNFYNQIDDVEYNRLYNI